MTRTAPSHPFGQPSLADLTARFLATRSDAASAAAVGPAAGTEVEPHEVAAGFRADPRAAWVDANAAVPCAKLDPAPADWAGVVASPVSVAAQPLAVGNFPQRVRDIHPLLARFVPADHRPKAKAETATGSTGLRTYAQQLAGRNEPDAALRAVGLARTAGDLALADALLGKAEGACTGDLRAAWENERAALLWHKGRCTDALAAWQAMADTPAAAFNRGMALLFLGNAAEARSHLTRAADLLPETGGWHALAKLYLAVADIHA